MAVLNSFCRPFILLLLLLCCAPAGAGEAEWKTLFEQANLHLQRGSIEQAELFAREAITEAERSFGRNSRPVDQSIATLGLVLRFAQRYPESEKELRRALALREKSLGPRDPAVGILLNNLADVVQAQKKFAEAEKLHRRVLAIFEKTYGDDPKTAASLNNLGAVLQAQGRRPSAHRRQAWPRWRMPCLQASLRSRAQTCWPASLPPPEPSPKARWREPQELREESRPRPTARGAGP